ncbi:hypothetical protein HETIRDRAFT_470482 [Heterobasidion irregulare TC 32-1]|uniref:Uncharacterized protein n=1 Tax=Heterobasidion irregulare (strain TC 32-1) TaxID=747525 RepID=W4KJI4_HETIT|nr:uncharacterized protein HETIRDRAFT_470482 [Heterobasidion irregulare TC 32-1]ETW85475.1 hypothetical protein HETIRDRAFT_470482 [Heterobasidion irregulare TC 32-1]
MYSRRRVLPLSRPRHSTPHHPSAPSPPAHPADSPPCFHFTSLYRTLYSSHPHRAARSTPHHFPLLPKHPARPVHLSIAIHPPILVVIRKEGSSILLYLDLIPRRAGRSHWLLSPSPLFLIMLLRTSHARYRLAGLGGCPAGLSRLRSTYSS